MKSHLFILSFISIVLGDISVRILLHGISEIFLLMYSFRTFMRYHFTPVWMAIINKSTNKSWQGCGKKRTLVHCWWECRLVQTLWKIAWNFLKKLKMELPFDPEISLLGLYSKNLKTPIQKNLCTPMFIATLFIIAKYRKQPKCPSVSEWIKNCGTFTQWNTTQQKERRSSHPSRQHGWIWRVLG